MKVVFLSNAYNHHQAAFSEAMDRLTSGKYSFIETQPLSRERREMGWGPAQIPSFVKRIYESGEMREECLSLIADADAVIYGSAPSVLVESRLKEHKLTMAYCERPFKKGTWRRFIPQTRQKVYQTWLRYQGEDNFAVLCASAYTSRDLSLCGFPVSKCYQWGYFPDMKRFDDIEGLIARKAPASLLWAARLIELKHPELAIEVARRLKKDGYSFELGLIGGGPMESRLREQVVRDGLEDCVQLPGLMPPERVREYMERAEIFLFTSDRNEGWGAVLNEAMNSGCAVVASHAIGSVPFLLEDGVNGLIYQSGKIESLYRRVKWLLDYPAERREYGAQAYRTLVGQWNAENAAARFLQLAQAFLEGDKHPEPFADGVCSRAEIRKDNWWCDR